MSAAIKQKRCRQCREPFSPFMSTEVVCSPRCAIAYSKSNPGAMRKLERRADRIETREKLEKLKTRRDYEREAQRHFNAWVRERDKFEPCISCGRTSVTHELRGGHGWHAGHYRSTGAAPELRFNELNCHKQCVRCNKWNSGNATDYRIGLVKRIGLSQVEMLEGPHEPKRYRIDELERIRDEYKAKTKFLKFQRSNAASFA